MSCAYEKHLNHLEVMSENILDYLDDIYVERLKLEKEKQQHQIISNERISNKIFHAEK